MHLYLVLHWTQQQTLNMNILLPLTYISCVFSLMRIEPMTCGYHCDWWELSDRWCSCSDGDYKLISQQAPGQASPRNLWHQTQSLHTAQVVRSRQRWCRCKISALPRTHSRKWLMVFHQSRFHLVMRPLLDRKLLWNLLCRQSVLSLLVWRWMVRLKLMPPVTCASNQCKPLYDGSQPVYAEDIMNHVYIIKTAIKMHPLAIEGCFICQWEGIMTLIPI